MNQLLNPGFNIGNLHIAWYGVLIALGMFVAILFCYYFAKYRKLKPDSFVALALWTIPLAIIGARVYYIAFSGRSWTFLEAIQIWNGGMAIYGGVIGGALGVLIFSLIHKKNFFDYADVIAPGLILAQSIGRWGNYINKEAYGWSVTNPSLQKFPFSVYIEHCTQVSEGCVCGGSGWHLATFFFESYLNFVGFFVLFLLLLNTKKRGTVVASYFVWYGVVRAIVETFRTDALFIGNSSLRVSQLLSIILVFVGLVILFYIYIVPIIKKKKSIKNNWQRKINLLFFVCNHNVANNFRWVVQLVEQRSPKPPVAGSSPVPPAKNKKPC